VARHANHHRWKIFYFYMDGQGLEEMNVTSTDSKALIDEFIKE